MDLSYIDRNLDRIKERAEKAAQKAGRNPGDITLLAAVKYAQPEEIVKLVSLGIRHIGENRVQQLTEHSETVGFEGLDVHFIGTLQTNKVKYISGRVSVIESVDSERLAEEIDRQAKKNGITADVFCEINSGREPGKSGVLPELAGEFCEKLIKYENIKLKGFMTMAPVCETQSEYREYFASTRETAYAIYGRLGFTGYPLLSMGMSGSFEAGIAEGADIVRIGRSLFEK